MGAEGAKPKRIFIGWSGSRSNLVAKALKYWLQCLSHDIEPWVSNLDLKPGRGWWEELETELRQSTAGILCISPENRDSPWLNFEAGALARSVERKLIIPYAIDMEASEISHPIRFFQGVKATQSETSKMASALFSSTHVDYDRDSNIFEVVWPLLERVLRESQRDPERAQLALAEIERVAIAFRTTTLKEVQFPPTARRGETVALEYLIDTKAQDVEIWLGASVCIGPGEWHSRKDQDEVVALERGVRRRRRKLTLSDVIAPGEYDFNMELWYGEKSIPRKAYCFQHRWPAGKIRIE